MAEISITRKHKLTARKAKAAAEELAISLRDEFSLKHEWVDPGHMRFKGLGVEGELVLARGEVTVNVSLGFLFLAFRRNLEAEIHRYFDERFGPAA